MVSDQPPLAHEPAAQVSQQPHLIADDTWPKTLSREFIDKANCEQIKALKLPIDQFTNDFILENKLFLPQVFELLNIMRNFEDYNQEFNDYIEKLSSNRRKKVQL